MAMSIAKRLMLACAGVVIGGLGFFTPRADAGMKVDLRVNPAPASNASYQYVLPTYNSSTQRWEVQQADTPGKYVLFDVVATVTGNASLDRTNSGVRVTTGIKSSPVSATYYPYMSYLAQGVVQASGTVSLGGNYATVLAPNSGTADSASNVVGIVPGNLVAGRGILEDNYNDGVASQSGVLGYDRIGTGESAVYKFARSIGPLPTDTTVDPDGVQPYAGAFNNYVSFGSKQGTQFQGQDDGVSPNKTLWPVLGDPKASQETFVLGQVTLYFGTGEAHDGTMSVKWTAVPSTLSDNTNTSSANSWVEDFVTGYNKPGTYLQGTTGNGWYLAHSNDTWSTNPTGFQVGDGISLEVVVPEPASLGLFAVGALVCGLRRNRRK